MNASNLSFVDLMKALVFLAIPILFLFFLVVLVPTNSLGSTGLVLILFWLLWREPDLRNRWWAVIWPWFLAVAIYFSAMSLYSFSAITALRDGARVLEGISFSLVALYLLQLSESQLRRALESVAVVLFAIVIVIVIFNLYHVGFTALFNNHGFEWNVNRNRLAVGFSMTAVFVAALMVEEQMRWKSVLWSGTLVFVCLAAVLNGSRGALVGMACALMSIIIAAVVRLGWRQVFRIDVWFLPLLSIFSTVLLFYYHKLSLDGFYDHGDGVDTGRFFIWQTVLTKLESSPWLGFGPHAIKQDVFLMPYGLTHFTHPHSIYVGLLYASGLFGVIFWIFWFWTFTSKLRNNFTANNNLAFYLGLGVLMTTLVHGVTDFDFYMLATMTFIIFGIVMMMPRLNINKG